VLSVCILQELCVCALCNRGIPALCGAAVALAAASDVHVYLCVRLCADAAVLVK